VATEGLSNRTAGELRTTKLNNTVDGNTKGRGTMLGEVGKTDSHHSKPDKSGGRRIGGIRYGLGDIGILTSNTAKYSTTQFLDKGLRYSFLVAVDSNIKESIKKFQFFRHQYVLQT
jgi:hypothetical protein